MVKLISTLILILLIAGICFAQPPELWKITAYCSCKLCCAKDVTDPAYNITASGKPAQWGYVACNWLDFGTKVNIKGLGSFVVMDRGAKSLFGSYNGKHIKHLDVWFPDHNQARKFGVKYMEVSID